MKNFTLSIFFTVIALTMFTANSYGQVIFYTNFTNDGNWINGTGTSYADRGYEENGWNFEFINSIRDTDVTYDGSSYSARNRGNLTVKSLNAVSDISGFKFYMRDWRNTPKAVRKIMLSVDGGQNWEEVGEIGPTDIPDDSFGSIEYTFPGGLQSFEANMLWIRILGDANNNNRIRVGGFEALGESNAVATPTFSPAPGVFTSPFNLTINTATEDAAVYYTLNGDDPTQESTLFTEPISITSTTTVKARAYLDGLDPSAVASGTFTFPTPIATIAELRQQSGTTPFVLTTEAILTFQQGFRNQKYIQDETGGILIDDLAGVITTSFNLYDGITGITGTLGEFGNMMQFIPIANPGPASSTGNIVTPILISLSDFVNDFETYESRLVTIQEVQFSSPSGNFATGQIYSITDGTITASFRTTFFDADYIGESIPTEPFNLTGLPNARSDGNFITARFESDFDFDLIGTNANLSVFKLGGLSALNLAGVVVTDPVTDQGAMLFVPDFNDFIGIEVTTAHPAATFTVELNGNELEPEDLATQALAADDVVVVHVIAEDEVTSQFYKVTLTEENRNLIITSPVGGEEYETGEPVTITWTSENISTLVLHVYMSGLGTPVAEYVDIPAVDGTFTENLPNGAHGQYYFRLSDASDPNFFAESEMVTFIDTQAPEVHALIPENNAVDVAADAIFKMIIDEEISPVSGKFIRFYKASTNELIQAIGTTSNLVNVDGNEVHFSPTNDLEFSTAYYILVEQGAFEDIAGNPLAAIETGQWGFTTQEEPVFELICNGDFEHWTDGKPDCWFGPKTNLPAAGVVQYTENPQSGNSAVQLIRSQNTHQRFTSQTTTVQNNKTYKVTFWLKGKGDIRTGIFDDRPDDYGYFYNDYINLNSNTWQEYTHFITAANNTNIAEFIFSLRNTDEALNHIQLDNVTITEASDEATQVANLLQLREGTIGARYQVSGEVLLTYQQTHRNQKYVQDGSAAIMIDDNTGVITTSYELGDGITGLTGTLINNSGMLQLVPTADPGAPSSTGNLIVPEVRTLESLTSADQAKLLKIENVTFASATGNFTAGTNYNLNSPNGTGVFRTSFASADYIGTSVPTAAQNLTVLVNQYLNTIQVTARSLADFEIFTSIPGLEFDEVSIFPNPFRDQIRINNLQQIEVVRLLSSTGQLIAEYQTVNEHILIGTSGLKNGLYFIQLVGNNGAQQVHKVIKH